MLRNYLTVIIRNIKRNFGYSAINVLGLSLGITCSLVLFLLVSYYTSFDNYHKNKDRIYRIVTASDSNGREDFTPGVPPPLPDAVRNDFSGIEKVLFVSGSYNGLFSVEYNASRKVFEQEERFGFTDNTYFTVFDRELISGNATSALNAPNQVLLSKSTAEKFFGNIDPINKVVRLNNSVDLKVTGVMEDAPSNTNLPFEILISYATIAKEKESYGWGSVGSDDQCYLLLEPGVNPNAIDDRFPEFIRKYQGEEMATKVRRWLQPLQDLSYDNRFSNYRYSTISKSTILAMIVVALFLVITACINFINLSTAVSVKRSKEVGIRKVLGGQRSQLMIQYLAETSVITLLAVVVSVGMSELALLQLNSFLDVNLHVDFTNPLFVVFILGVWLFVSLISGFYPALRLSGFRPVVALKNKLTNRSAGGFGLRRSLVVFQFIISQILVIGTVILISQMDYVGKKDLGFSRDAIISVPIPETAPIQNKETLKKSIMVVGGVEKASLCSTPPSSGAISSTNIFVGGIEDDYRTMVKLTDENYIDLFDVKLLAGQQLVESDTANACLVNEKLLKTIGIDNPEDVLGRNLRIWGMNLPVVGVIKDFHSTDLTREIAPVVLFNSVEDFREVAVKVNMGNFKQTISEIQSKWETLYPDFLFSYQFLDDQIAEFYESEQRMSVLLLVFSSIAIAIGCLGLYGLISFMANEKEKEIGVRKVLGASVINILFLFSREFVGLILIAFVVASPLAAYVMDQWLGNFVYRVDLNVYMFLTGMLVTFIIAISTVGYRSVRASLTNPIEALRNE